MTVKRAISLLAVITICTFVAHLVFQQLIATNKAENKQIIYKNTNVYNVLYL